MAKTKEEIIEFGSQIKEYRRRENVTQQELSANAGVSQSTLASIESGKVVALGDRVYNRIMSVINSGKVEKRPPVCEVRKIENATGRMVPIISQAAAAEVNTLVFPIAEYATEFGESRMRYFPDAKPGDFAIEVSGNSMEPYYPDKTILLVRPNSRIPNNSPVVVVLRNGDVIFKIYYERNRGREFLLASVNKKSGNNYKYTLETAWEVRAIYRVVSSVRDEIAIRDALVDNDDVWND